MSPTSPPPTTPGVNGVNIVDWWPWAKNFNNLADFFSFMMPKILLLGGIIFFVMVVIAGAGVVIGAGGDDPHKQEQSKNFLTYALIGLIIMFGAYWILQIVNFITGGSLGGLGL
jgi:hypothetical protein